MKYISQLLVLFFFVSAVQAQERFIRTDSGIGGAFTFGNISSYGISASVEPKFFINPQISVGLRIEGDVLFGGNIDSNAGDVDVRMSSRAAQLLKGEYYLSENNTRPFFGLGLGRYVQANIGANSSGGASIAAGVYWGVAPEIGITFGNFRVSALYNVVPGNDLVTVNNGETLEVGRNYLVVQLGFKVFQFDL